MAEVQAIGAYPGIIWFTSIDMTIIMIVRLIKNKKYPVFLSCISAYFCGLTHLVLSTYLPRKQVYLSQLASQRIWPRPKFLKGPLHLFRNWITKRRAGRPSTKKKRTTNRYFYPSPIFRDISSFPRAMDEKIIFRLKSNWANVSVEVGYITWQGLPGARRKEMQTLSMWTQQMLFSP